MPKESKEAAFVFRMIRSDDSWEHQERAVYTVEAMRRELDKDLPTRSGEQTVRVQK